MHVSVFRRLPVLFLALALFTTACGRGGGDEAKPTPKSQAGTLAAAPGFDPATGVIKIGMLTPLTGPVAVIGEAVTNGHRVLFDALNAKGGVAGKYKVELVVEDDMFDNPTAVQKYQKIKDQVLMFGQLLGTPQTHALRPQLKTDGIVAAPASIDAEWIADLNLLPLSASVQIQFLNAAEWYLKEGGGQGKAICLMTQDNPLGEAARQGLEAASKALGFPIKATVVFKLTDQEFSGHITQLKNAGCEAVFLLALPSNTGPILGTGAKLGFAPQWIGASPVWITALAKSPQLLPILEKSLIFAFEGPTWGDESVPGMRRMLADIRAHRPDQSPDHYFTYGYGQAILVAAFLEKAVELGDLSRDGLLEAQRQLGTVDFGGLFGSYTYGDPAKRNPSRATSIFKVNPAVPGAIEAVKVNFTSEAAKAFSFERYLTK